MDIKIMVIDILIFISVHICLPYLYIEGSLLIYGSIVGSYVIFCTLYEWVDRHKMLPPLRYGHLVQSFFNMNMFAVCGFIMYRMDLIYDSYTYSLLGVRYIAHRIEMYVIIPIWVVIFELFFYWSHRLMHYPLFYKHIHKKHHEYRYTRPIYCQYSTPIDCLISTCIPVYAILSLIRIPTHIFLGMIVVMIKHNVDSHRFRLHNDHHAIHHRDGRYNLGNFSTTDMLFGTA